jgi:hypothetical protein
MCEMLVRVIDKVHPDPYTDANHCTKRGDVIVIFEDGHEWGRSEIDDPQYTIVKVPKVPAALAEGFVAPEVDTDHQHPSRMLQARAFKFNLEATPDDFFSLMAAKIRKPALQDPNVIG